MTSTDATLAQRHAAVLPRWVSTYYEQPLVIAEGSGRHVTDAEGRTYLDFFGGILTTSVGYDVAEVREAVSRQLARGVVHTSTLYAIESQVALAERIAGLAGIDDPAVFFANSGSEANETALLAACCQTGSNRVVALEESYHGRTFGAVAVSTLEGWRPTPYSPFELVTAGNGRHRGVAESVAALDQALGTAPVAALIAEPVQGLGGFHRLPDGLLRGYADVVAERGGLLICDEVQTAWGRTGEAFWGYQAQDVRPDLITFAKGVANGFALGGVVGRRAAIDSIPGKSISTFGGNPLATTAALATLDYVLDHDLRRNAQVVGAQLLAGLRELAGGEPRLVDPRGYGLMLAVDCATPTGEPDPAAARALLADAREQGLLIGIGGAAGSTLRMAPPLSVTAAEATEALTLLAKAAQTALAG
jgi:4-aminobutyrate aminotransferase